jgi:ATP-binding cassette subfamily F protein 3
MGYTAARSCRPWPAGFGGAGESPAGRSIGLELAGSVNVSLVVIENGALGFGGRTIFSGLSLRVGEEDRIGIVGRNGAGKSSLLRIVAAERELESGAARFSRGVRVGYLPQEIDMADARGVLDFVVAGVPGRERIEVLLEDVSDQLAAGTCSEDDAIALSQKLADLHEELNAFEAHFSPHEAMRILAGLGFRESDLGRSVTELSGGWRMRAVLASLLFQRPDLLLLDEPTNHLDVPSVDWLSGFLKKHHGAVMLICHDREFLNEQVDRIVSFESEGVRQYKGDYESYRRARAEEIEVLERRAANVARERDQAEAFIRRFRAKASKARLVQSRIKALERLEDAWVPEEQRSLSFRFPPCKRAGQETIVLEGLGQDYGQGPVIRDVDAMVRRGDRVALVGANGNGKSTLLRIMAGVLAPSMGSCLHGHNVDIGYYAQHVTEQLDLADSVFESVWGESAVHDVSTVRSALGTMMFSGDDVDKKVGVLSGGEKARVALARLLVKPGNVVLMDEPTNHLDLESAEALAEALTGFEGTLIFASHNKSFVNRLATRIWNIEGGRMEEYPGTLAEYLERRTRLATAPSVVVTSAVLDVRVAKHDRRLTREEEKAARARRRELARTVADYEKRIAELETVQAQREGVLSDPATYEDRERYDRIVSEYQRDGRKIEELMARWERAQAELATELEGQADGERPGES